MLYPARVRIDYGDFNYAMITLEQANQRFVIVDGELVHQKVVPMSAADVQERLDYYLEDLKDRREYLEIMGDTIEGKLQKCIKEIENNISVLMLAKQHYTNVELAKERTCS